ncbi:hypothetical protein AGMMS50239_07140 [Bacteroidia bacterium]|nr:hypothetical protein AGMMS50239_07140 [Bacteroidia bacterium]
MNNRHNPIARIIEKLQVRWQETVSERPDYRVVRWLIDPEESELINGFFRLESSAYGSLPEFFIVMLTPFEKFRDDFSKQLIVDFVNMWEQDQAVKEYDVKWNPSVWLEKGNDGANWTETLIGMLTDFQKQVCNSGQVLVFGLIPRTMANFYDFNNWIMIAGEKLPPEIKLSFVDHIGKNYLKESVKNFKSKGLTIECGDLNIRQTVRQMATAGEKNDPEAAFRKCLFEMGDGVSKKNTEKVNHWGKEAILIAQKSGVKSFLATAYLVYAGFLLQLRKNEVDNLLDQGIKIAESVMGSGDETITAVLLQLYGYKAACQNINGSKKDAVRWLSKQAHFAVDNNHKIYGMSICRLLAKMAKGSWNDDIYRDSLELGYHAGDELSESELRASEIKILAYYYARELEKENRKTESNAIHERMTILFGEGWDENMPSLSGKAVQTIPDVKETIEVLKV